MGNPEATVTVIAFSDFQCPFCQKYFKNIEPTVIADFVETNKIHYIYSPMAFLGQESNDAAEAAYCANDQQKFWEYHAQLYINLTGENNGSYSMSNLRNFAGKIGLDLNTFDQCMNSDKHLADLSSAEVYASNAGIHSTPSFLVNDKLVYASGLVQAINDALQGK
jgi:protein-disulfide isomerase